MCSQARPVEKRSNAPYALISGVISLRFRSLVSTLPSASWTPRSRTKANRTARLHTMGDAIVRTISSAIFAIKRLEPHYGCDDNGLRSKVLHLREVWCCVRQATVGCLGLQCHCQGLCGCAHNTGVLLQPFQVFWVKILKKVVKGYLLQGYSASDACGHGQALKYQPTVWTSR